MLVIAFFATIQVHDEEFYCQLLRVFEKIVFQGSFQRHVSLKN